jgi:putative aldouronate transport system substrate-binding protein
MIRKLVCALLLLGAAAALFASGQSDAGKAASLPAFVTTPPGTFPVVKDKQTMTVLTYQPAFVKDFYSNEFTKRYEEMTNVHVEWEVVANMVEKVNLLVAGGDLPDVIWPGSFPKDLELMYGQQGVFIRLNELIDSLTVDIKKSLEQFPTAKEAVVTPTGAIYSLPMIQDGYHIRLDGSLTAMIWMNSTWLKQLGLATPQTTEDLASVLKAFRDKDPNGNGKADEIPFTGESGLRAVYALMTSFTPTYASGQYAGLYLDDQGRIRAATVTPEFKAGLTYLARLFKEGLIDQNIFTMNTDQMKKITENPSGIILGSAVTGFNGTFNMGGTNHKNYDPIPPVKGPGGARWVMYTPYFNSSGAMFITNKMKHPDVAMRYVDWFYSPDGLRNSRFGPKDIAWRDAKPGEKAYTGQPAVWAQMGAATQVVSNLAWLQHGHPQNLGIVHTSQLGNDDMYATGTPALLTRVYRFYLVGEPYLYKPVIPPMYLSSDKVKEVAQLRTDIDAYMSESIVRFVTGTGNIDAEWDAYVKQLNAIGLPKLVEIYQNAYSQRTKK